MRRALTLIPLLFAVTSLAPACGGSGGSGGDGSNDAARSTTTTRPTYADLEAADITFNPVVKIVACDGSTVPDATETSAASSSTRPTVPSIDGRLCYVLGPAGGDGDDLRDAKVYADGVGIEVAVRDDSVDALNPMFNACYRATKACPAASTDGKGYVAIVIDGRVVSTPAVNEADLAASPFVITGDFDNTQAKAIAAAINGG